jgi:hypothetical protein
VLAVSQRPAWWSADWQEYDFVLSPRDSTVTAVPYL